jgi:hypothetical protein
MAVTTLLGGPAEIAINNITIPPSLLSEVSTEFTEGERERQTLGGHFTRPSGLLDTAQVKFTMFLPSMDYLKTIFPSRYNAPSGTQGFGNVIINSDTCVTVNAGPMNIHYTCENNDNNDIYIYSGLALLDFQPTYNESDQLSIDVTVYAQPDSAGNVVRLGTGMLNTNSRFVASTMTTQAYVS